MLNGETASGASAAKVHAMPVPGGVIMGYRPLHVRSPHTIVGPVRTQDRRAAGDIKHLGDSRWAGDRCELLDSPHHASGKELIDSAQDGPGGLLEDFVGTRDSATVSGRVTTV